jgi:hypothetical protein
LTSLRTETKKLKVKGHIINKVILVFIPKKKCLTVYEGNFKRILWRSVLIQKINSDYTSLILDSESLQDSQTLKRYIAKEEWGGDITFDI